ncbi:MAG: thioredoxin family protein [Desulfurococcaceae archaeon]
MIRKIIGIFLIMVIPLYLYSHVTYASFTSAGCLENTNFYMFGASWCPHCKNLDRFFTNEFPESHYFCVIDKIRECYERFTSLSNDFKLGGYVPITIVVKDSRYILAIVIGEVVDKEFWLNLTCLTPSESIPVYTGTDEVFRVSLNTTDHGEYIRKYIIYPQSVNPGFLSEYIATIAIMAIVLLSVFGYLVYTRFSK